MAFSRSSTTRTSTIRSSYNIPYMTQRDMQELGGEQGSQFRGMRFNEKEELKGLNNSFAGYIERVRFLEQQNALLEAQLRQRSVKYGSKLPDLYTNEVEDWKLLSTLCTLTKH